MNKVTVLIEGYVDILSDKSWDASSTVTLIQTKDQNIIVDPGCDRPQLIEALKKQNLNLEDIHWVFLTHHHLDHTILAGIFPNAAVIDGNLFQKGTQGSVHDKAIPGTDINIIKTPGHANNHFSLLVETEKGIVAIAGDAIWWKSDEEQIVAIDHPDTFMSGDIDKLKQSRQNLLDQANYVIPGHGKMFKVEK